MKERGIVRSFSAAKGYGLIRRSDGVDFYVHSSAVGADGCKALEEGQAVEFIIVGGCRGPQAANVTIARAPRNRPESISTNSTRK